MLELSPPDLLRYDRTLDLNRKNMYELGLVERGKGECAFARRIRRFGP